MKNLVCVLCFPLLILFAGLPEAPVKSLALINRIEGRVYDPNRLPVENVYVELLNDVDSVIARTRTDASGRFSFAGMPPGRFIVKVLPLGTNLMEQSQEVQITNATRTRNDTAYIDFYLRYDKRSSGGGNETTRDV